MTFHRTIALVIATMMPVFWAASGHAFETGQRRASVAAAGDVNVARINAYKRWKAVNRAGQVGINPQPLPPRMQ